MSVCLNVGTAIPFITLDWEVSTFSDRYVTFYLTNCVFPSQIREITCKYLNRYRRELYIKTSILESLLIQCCNVSSRYSHLIARTYLLLKCFI